jgi:hypothetical protein
MRLAEFLKTIGERSNLGGSVRSREAIIASRVPTTVTLRRTGTPSRAVAFGTLRGSLLASASPQGRPAGEESVIGLNLREELEQRGISRRDFLEFCASMASVLGLPGATAAIAEAVEKEPRP